MRKQKILKIIPIATFMTAVLSPGMAYAAPPVYVNNVAQDAYISVIDFSRNTISMSYETDNENDLMVRMIALQYGPMTDYQLHWWSSNQISDENVVIYSGDPTNFDSFFRSGTTVTLGQPWIRSRSMLDNGYGRIEYLFATYQNNSFRGRADYNRCIKSEAFLSGRATQCRAELLGDGMLQYQPYDSQGNRLELSAEEDAILTTETLSWRAEPGDWGPEWYADEDGDTENNINEEAGEETDGENQEIENENENGNGNGIEDTSTNALTTAESTPSTPSAPAILASDVKIIETDSTSGSESPIVQEEQIVEQKNQESDESFSSIASGSDEVEIPNLSKESEQSLLAPILIAIGLLMLAAGWWLLFFGKSKITERKENEER